MKTIINISLIITIIFAGLIFETNDKVEASSGNYEVFLPMVVNGSSDTSNASEKQPGETVTPTTTPVEPTPTNTPAPVTSTPVAPTATPTEPQPTYTPVPPTATPVEPAPTATPVPPTSTPVEPTPTNTPVTPTVTPTLVETSGNSFYVAPNGSPSGDGSINNPWDLQTALNHPASVQAGDTIWLRNGQYVGEFISRLKGAEGQPITVRQYPGERATLVETGMILDIQDTWYVDFWGFEVTSNNNPRDPDTRPLWAFGIRAHQGFISHHIRYINLFVHDMPAQGFGWWTSNQDSEIYGSLIYFNGVTELDHAIYTKNETGNKVIEDNFIFDNASHGVHAYSSNDNNVDNFRVEGNTIFNNGSIGWNTYYETYGIYKRNILLGAYDTADNPIVRENYTYYPNNSGYSLNLGYQGGSDGAIVEGNYLMGGQMVLGGGFTNMSMNNNAIYGGESGFTESQFPNNDYYDNKPTGEKIFVRANKFESNRANVTIYNWDQNNTVILTADDLAELDIPVGANYQLHNVQDFYGDIITGTYNGSFIEVPMTGHSVAQPLGLSFKPATSFPEFGGFVLTFTN